MAIDKDKLREQYPDINGPVKRPDYCSECPFEEILEYGVKNKVSNLLEKDINEKGNRPDREFIEQICGKKYDGVCYIKYEVERLSYGDYILGQFEAGRIFRHDINKNRELKGENKFIESLSDIMREWATPRDGVYNKNGDASNYAERWSEVWNASIDRNGHHVLTEAGIYKYVVSENGNYKKFMEDLDSLKEEETKRHENGIDIDLIDLI